MMNPVFSFHPSDSHDAFALLECVMETCENCGRQIGNLETPHLWQGKIVCIGCANTLAQSSHSPTGLHAMPAPREGEYTALGLNSKKTAVAVSVVGAFLSPALVGIPLLVWGLISYNMLKRHQAEASGMIIYRKRSDN